MLKFPYLAHSKAVLLLRYSLARANHLEVDIQNNQVHLLLHILVAKHKMKSKGLVRCMI